MRTPVDLPYDVVTIEVTQADIDEGLRGVCSRCPVALAVARELDRRGLIGWSVSAGTLTYTIRDPKYFSGFAGREYYPSYGRVYGQVCGEWDSGVISWIRGFDRGEKMAPMWGVVIRVPKLDSA